MAIIPIWLLLVSLPVIGYLAMRSRAYAILLMPIFFLSYPGEWGLPVRIDPLDLVLMGLFGWAVVGNGKEDDRSEIRLPAKLSWILMGGFMTVAYLTADINRQYLTDPVRIGYQVYRYAWKFQLFFLAAALLVRTTADRWKVALGMVLGGVILSIPALFQGLQGLRAGGFWGPNALGGLLLAPMSISIAALLVGRPTRERWFHAISLLIMLRALLYSGSRSALVGLMLASAIVLLRMTRKSVGRFIGVSALLFAGVLALLVIIPDLTQRPNVQRMLTIFQASEQETLQWRINERWDHFFNAALENPWFGRGHDVDLENFERGPGNALTPHNSYLSQALLYGFPATILMAMLLMRSVANGLLKFGRLKDPEEEVLALASSGAVIAIMVHAAGDGIMQISFVAWMMWTLAGFNMSLSKPERVRIQTRGFAKTANANIGISEF